MAVAVLPDGGGPRWRELWLVVDLQGQSAGAWKTGLPRLQHAELCRSGSQPKYMDT